ncbi:hypothetical protein BU23DRAFT_461729 [Bimuria novae-zelandiae CBS 107.79]|uniref:Coenzyme Q-binding protein COQ10 START domain-containing protein n=1 Tax=Bimuria novae-zelandiae CBS 107.79 TaxID=1447943 RepID=A0A6A5VBB1_9PLEO|nr:hypothetical protein BU23DRAFT_461729 [Bimuria novae-zelandiae CBS 107.79]
MLLFLGVTSLAQSTNLPDVAPGVFNVTARIEIENTSVEAAWNALSDFPKYPNWNPFVRSQIAVDASNISLPTQRPVENTQLIIRCQIPPLPLPVSKYTLDNPLATQFSYENVTHVQPELRRLAWGAYPNPLIMAERWQALTDLGNGKIRYESREVFSGPLAPVLQPTMQANLQKSFDAQAQGLKLLLEGGGAY